MRSPRWGKHLGRPSCVSLLSALFGNLAQPSRRSYRRYRFADPQTSAAPLSRAPGGASSFTAVLCKVEAEDALEALGTLEHLRMAQRAYRVVVAGAPVVLHARPREL